MRYGVVVFPGSNCDHDCYWALKHQLKFSVRFLWHRQRDTENCDCLILPGGFSYGDYLRAGAIARFSPIMESVCEHAEKGRPVIGICNGFQILTEIGLLPGSLLVNESLRFVHKPVCLSVERNDSIFTSKYSGGEVIELPIAHGQGRYLLDAKSFEELEANKMILFRYCDPEGRPDPVWNPNGSLHHAAGICNQRGNVMGMMPHPERRMNKMLGGIEGQRLFLSVAEALS